MAVNFRIRRNSPLSRLNAQPRSLVTVWKPLGDNEPPEPPDAYWQTGYAEPGYVEGTT